MIRKYVSYKDDDSKETIVQGYFDVLNETEQFIEIISNQNKLKIPYHRVLKIKESKWIKKYFLFLEYFYYFYH